MSDPVKSGGSTYTNLVSQYAKIQSDAFTSQSAKSAEISKLRDDFASYFEQHPENSADSGKLLKGLEDMTAMAQAHEADSSHTDNANWGSLSDDMDALVKELAPTDADTSAIATERTASSAASSAGGAAGAGATAVSAAKTDFKGVSMVSMDAMVAKFPQLAPYKDALQKAADQYKIPVQLLAAQAMQESHANPSEQGGGMFQFIPSTWNSYGNGQVTEGGNYSSFFSAANVADQAMAAAKYDADLLNQNGGDLNTTLRDYNGPVANGANSEYQTQIGKWMNGIDGYQG